MRANMRRISVSLALAMMVALVAVAWPAHAQWPAPGIVGTPHDMSANGWVADADMTGTGEICIVCHTPHNADTSNGRPLWNHDVTVATHTPYTSPTLDADTSSGPTGVSILCLSCHDGTVAIDAFGDNLAILGPMSPAVSAMLGTDLSNDHPVSFDYDAAAALDGGLNPSGDADGSALAPVRLYAGEVQCASCHEPHNRYGIPFYLRVDNSNQSALCLTCHDK